MMKNHSLFYFVFKKDYNTISLENWERVGKMEIRQGDIFKLKIMDGDQEDFRYNLIISNDLMNKNGGVAIGVLISNRFNKAVLPSHVEINGTEHNLPKDSIIVCEQVRTIAKSNLIEKVSRINDETLAKVSKAFSVNTFVDEEFFEKVNLSRIYYIKGQQVPLKEDYDTEFKVITQDKTFKQMSREITERCVKYMCAFLNNGGGRLLFGIEDKTGIIKGFTLPPEEKDLLSQAVNSSLLDCIYPKITTLNFRMEFHQVLLDDPEKDHYDDAENEYVLELLVYPPLDPSVVYFTNENRVITRLHERNKELKFTEITDFILNKAKLKNKG